jgi:hypothetical protein
MKLIILAATALLSFQAFSSTCEMKTSFDLNRGAIVNSILFSDSPEANLDCSQAYIDYLYNGSTTGQIDDIKVPVIITQSFNEVQAQEIDGAAVLEACMKNLYVFSMVIEGPLMTLRSVHVKYKNVLD